MADKDQGLYIEPDEKEKRAEQTVTIKDLGPARKRLTIEIPQERIAKSLDDSFDKLKGESQVPGFRRGRAPLRLLQKRLGSAVRDDVRGRLVSDSYTQAVEEEKLEVIGEPDVPDIEQIVLPDEGPLSFKVEIEVAPKVELPSLEGIKVEKIAVQVTDADVEREIERLRESLGRSVQVKNTKVQADDFVACDVRVLDGDHTDPRSDETEEIVHHPVAHVFVRGKEHDYKGHVAGILVDDLGKQLTGKRAGDELAISMTGPPGHEDERIKDRPITIAIRIDAVQRVEPAPIETLMSNAGADSVDDLKAFVRDRIESRGRAGQRGAMHRQVCQFLLDKIDLQLPEGLTQRQTERTLMRRRMELTSQGVPEQEIDQRVAEMRSSSEELAIEELKQFFILNQASRNLEIEVSESEVNGYIATLAGQQGHRPEKLRQQMRKNGEIEHLYLQIREQKTLDRILEKAEVIEKDAPQDVRGASEKTTKKKTTKARSAGKTGAGEKKAPGKST